MPLVSRMYVARGRVESVRPTEMAYQMLVLREYACERVSVCFNFVAAHQAMKIA